MADYQIASSYSLTGHVFGRITIQKFSGIKMEVETSPNVAGNKEGGVRTTLPKPGPTKPGSPTFVAPIEGGALPLAEWWEEFNPSAMQGRHVLHTLTFSFEGENRQPFAQWQLIGAFPKSYELSGAEVGNAELATETIILSVTEIVRMM